MPASRYALLLGLVVFVACSSTVFAQPNEIIYSIDAKLDLNERSVHGSETISFTNLTGQQLNELNIYLYPNRFKEKSVAALWEDYEDFDSYFPEGPDWGYLEILSISINGSSAVYEINDILMRVDLAEPLDHGSQLSIDIEFRLKLPRSSRRLGFDGTSHYLSWWYPQMSVHDGEKWHTELMVGVGPAEPFQDFASYDVTLNVPQEMIVGATGDLQSDELHSNGTKTLRYTASNVHDFAWVADSNYIKETFDCDGIQINSLYLPRHTETAQPQAKTACEALGYFGERFGQYPYRQFTIAEAGLRNGAMEYPQMIMNGELVYRIPRMITLGDLVTAHEVAHQWFYGFMANNQIAETWLDEGFAEYGAHSYIEDRYGDDTNLFDTELLIGMHGEFFKNAFVQIFSSIFDAEDMDDIRLDPPVSLGQQNRLASLLTHSAEVPLGKQILPYHTGATILFALEDYLGREQLDRIIQTYVQRLRFSHVTTDDFISIAEEVSGEDLDWFFDSWLRTTDSIDYAVRGMEKEQVGDEFILRVRLRNNGAMRMPVSVELQFGDEETEPLRQRWANDESEGELYFTADRPATQVVIDPDRVYPDLDRTNNKIQFPLSFEPYIRHGFLSGWPEDGFHLGGGISLIHLDLSAKLFYILNRKKIGFDVEFSQPFAFGDRRTSDLNIHLRDDSHVLSGDLTAGLRWFTPFSFLWRATHNLGFGPFYRDRHDVDADPGISIGAFANYRLELRDQRARVITLILNHRRNLEPSDFSFSKSSIDVRIEQRIFWQTYLGGRVFYGLKTGSEPVDDSFNLVEHGFLRTFDRSSDRLISANAKLEFPLPKLNYIDIGFLPIQLSAAGFFFADGALFPDEENELRADAGVGLMLGFYGARDLLRLELPLWVNTEDDGGKKELRFQVSAEF